MQPLSSKPTAYFPALTGLRAVAAYLVYIYHYPLEFWAIRPVPLSSLIREFHVGVTIFFVLSGFLITFRYLGKSQLTGPFLQQYLLNRVARIYPIYFLLTTAQFLNDFSLPWSKPLIKQYLANITFLRGFSQTLRFTGVQPGWSLTVEECFYLFAPLLFYMLVRWKHNRILVWLGSSLLLAGTGASLTYLLHGQPIGAFATYSFTFNATFFGRFSEFFIGAGLAIHLRAHPETTRWTASGYFTQLGLVGSAATMVCMVLVQYALSAYPESPSTSHLLGFLLNGTLLPVFICCLFYGLIKEKTWLSSILAHPVSEALGKSSYAFYLVHMSFLPLLFHVDPHHAGSGQYIGYFFVCLLLSLGIYYLIEEPCNRWMRGFSKPG